IACDLRRRLGERAEDAAGVEPARPFTREDRGPVDVARSESRDRRVAAVRTADRAANAVATLDEVQSVTDVPADPVVRDPAYVGLIDAALVDQVLHQTAHRIVGKR